MVSMLKNKTPMKTLQYETCTQGCMMYQKDDDTVSPYPYCKKTTRESFGMFSIGDRVATLLSNDETEAMMKYRSSRRPNACEYEDILDGKDYKDLVAGGEFAGENDVALVMMIDGFSPNNGNHGSKLNLIQFVNYNMHPSVRYLIFLF